MENADDALCPERFTLRVQSCQGDRGVFYRATICHFDPDPQTTRIESPVFVCKKSRRRALDALYDAISHTLRRLQFPDDTLCFKQVVGTHGPVVAVMGYPDEHATTH